MISTVILARLLAPKDYGLVAMAMSIMAILQLLGSFGFDSALIQMENAERKHYDTVWTFRVGFGLTFAVLILLLAHPAARFYRQQDLIQIMWVLAGGAILTGFSNVGTIMFRKEMLFNKEFMFLFARRFSAFAVTLVMAFILRNYWALVGGMATGLLVSCVASYALHPFRPRFSLAGRKDIMQFSKWMFVSSVTDFVRDRSTDFILGRFGGAAALGIYNLSAEVGLLPVTELSMPINRAAYPGYSLVAGDKPKLRDEFLKTMSFVVLIVLPAGVGLSLVAKPLVAVMLGPKWVATIPLVRIIALSTAVMLFQSNIVFVLFALGKPAIVTALEATATVVYVPMLLWAAIRFGAIGAAWSVLGFALLITPIMNFALLRMLGLVHARLLGVSWRPAIGTLLMGIAVMSLERMTNVGPGAASNLGKLLFLMAVGAVVYTACVLLLWFVAGRPPGAEQVVMENLKENERLASLRRRIGAVLGRNA